MLQKPLKSITTVKRFYVEPFTIMVVTLIRWIVFYQRSLPCPLRLIFNPGLHCSGVSSRSLPPSLSLTVFVTQVYITVVAVVVLCHLACS